METLKRPDVTGFFDSATNTVTYLVVDPETRACAIIDPVLDYDAASGRTDHASADTVIAAVRTRGLAVEWIFETHVHADHLTAAPYLRAALGGRIAIGARVGEVQGVFARVFGAEPAFTADGRQFDHLFVDGERLEIGALTGTVIATPGHTPACVSYLIGDAVFVGDTLFMPDYGTARTDFPGGDATTLYRSIQRLFALPAETRVFTCHDYKAPGRDVFAWQSTIGAQRASNVHIHEGVDEAAFVAMRQARDKGLAMPKLILPSVQVNMRAGAFPPPEPDGRTYLKIPVDGV